MKPYYNPNYIFFLDPKNSPFRLEKNIKNYNGIITNRITFAFTDINRVIALLESNDMVFSSRLEINRYSEQDFRRYEPHIGVYML